MNIRPGRNDPCHCGSGRKYKKCHLADDETREQARIHERLSGDLHALAAPGATGPAVPFPPSSPLSLPVLQAPSAAVTRSLEAAESPAWDAFMAASYEDKLAMFEEAVATGDIDPDSAFDMLGEIHPLTVERNERDRFGNLQELLRERRPEVYEADLVWHLAWLIEDAVAEGAYDRIPPLMAPLAGVADDQIEEVFQLLDVLMFHGQTEPLIDMMTRAWPAVSDSRRILPGGIAQFAAKVTMLILFNHLEGGGAPDAHDPALRAALAPLDGTDDRYIQSALDALSGTLLIDWQPDDFTKDDEDEDDDDGSPAEGDDGAVEDQPARDLLPVPAAAVERETADDDDRDEDEEDGAWERPVPRIAENLFVLSLEWAGMLHRERGVPLSRIEMMRDPLVEYLLSRPADRHGPLPLLPDKPSVERFLIQLTSSLSGRYYEAGALFALLPAFIDMLVARGLARRDAARRARGDILTLRTDLLRIIRDATTDPALAAAVAAGDAG